jgi:hypothetical protein
VFFLCDGAGVKERLRRRLAIIELDEANLCIGIDESLLVDAVDAFQCAHIEGVMRAA